MRTRLSLAAVGIVVALILSGCGSSGSNPPSPLSITTSSLPQGIVNTPYTASVSATGGVQPYAWSIGSGSLPAGIVMSRDGIFSGTPTAPTSAAFTVTVTDSEKPPAVNSVNLTITVNPPLTITTSALPDGKDGIPYTVTLSASGGIAPLTWAVTQGSLPAGLTLNATTGAISGTPNASGTFSFTVGVSDSANPPDKATAALSIVIAPPPPPPPPTGAAVYLEGPTSVLGLSIASDGSLSPLASSPEPAILGYIALSSKAPSAFVLQQTANTQELQALVVNPDYSLTPYTSTSLVSSTGYFQTLAVDPTGQDLYMGGTVDNNGTQGVLTLTADGVFTAVGTTAVPSVSQSLPMVFTPDGKLGFISTCGSPTPELLSFARSDNGTLTQVGSVSLASCLAGIAVSSDGKYLATSEVQVYSIAPTGTVTAVLASPFQVTFSQGTPLAAQNMTWDASSAYLLVATGQYFGAGLSFGGVAVLSFSGTALTETVEPTGDNPALNIVRTGSFVYAPRACFGPFCSSPGPIYGYDFQNGLLNPLPGSPYPGAGQIVLY